MEIIENPMKVTLNNMAMQFLSLAIAIVISYGLTSLILTIIKVPTILRNFIATVVTLIVMYYTYIKIFL